MKIRLETGEIINANEFHILNEYDQILYKIERIEGKGAAALYTLFGQAETPEESFPLTLILPKLEP